MVETVSDEGGKLGGDAVAGRFLHEAVQGANLGKRPGESQPAAQAERGCATGRAQERSTVHGARSPETHSIAMIPHPIRPPAPPIGCVM